MSNEGYHEPVNELSDETRDMHRAIASLMEELGAVARKFLAKERSLAVAIVPADKPSIAGPSNRLEEQRVGVFE